jgi:hypothetical protein
MTSETNESKQEEVPTSKNTSSTYSRIINESFIYIAISISLIVFVLGSFRDFGIEVTQDQILLLSLVLVLLLFRHFSVIEVPGFLKLSKKVEEIRKETAAIRDALFSMAISQSNSSAVVNFNQLISDTAREASEIGGEIPEISTPPDDQLRLNLQRIRRHVDNGEFIAAFATLRNSIETTLREILSVHGEDRRYDSLGQLTRSAGKLGVLDPTIIEAISVVNYTANTVLHSAPYEKNISMDKIRQITELGIKTLSELQRVRNRMPSSTLTSK